MLQTIFCQAPKSSYTENDQLEWVMTFENKRLVANSVRISGTLRVQHNGSNITHGQNIFMDSQVGIHSFWDNWNVSMDNIGFVEQLNQYGRFVKQMNQTSQTSLQAQSETDKTVELLCGSDSQTAFLLQGMSDAPSGASATKPVPFNFKPKFCLNKMTANLPYKKSGSVRVSVKMTPILNALFGSTVNSLTTYTIENLELHYQVVPDTGAGGDLVIETSTMIRTMISSTNQNVSSKVPLVSYAVTGNFIKSSESNTYANNSFAMQEPPSVDRVTFHINDNNQLVSFPLISQEEILLNYLDAAGSSRYNDLRLSKLREGESYGVGLNFGGGVDFTNMKFGMNLLTNVSNADPYVLFLFFHGVMKL